MNWQTAPKTMTFNAHLKSLATIWYELDLDCQANRDVGKIKNHRGDRCKHVFFRLESECNRLYSADFNINMTFNEIESQVTKKYSLFMCFA